MPQTLAPKPQQQQNQKFCFLYTILAYHNFRAQLFYAIDIYNQNTHTHTQSSYIVPFSM